jgi:hypothetical protein
MTSPDPVPLGGYRGFDMALSFDSFDKEYRVTLKGALSHDVRLGTDIHGNITRLDNALDNLGDTMRRLENGLVSTKERCPGTLKFGVPAAFAPLPPLRF